MGWLFHGFPMKYDFVILKSRGSGCLSFRYYMVIVGVDVIGSQQARDNALVDVEWGRHVLLMYLHLSTICKVDEPTSVDTLFN